MTGEHMLDVSMLQPPEPMERALSAIETLAPGDYLCLLHRREPLLLYPVLEKLGFSYRMEFNPAAASHAPYRVYIWRVTDDSAATRVDQALAAHGREVASSK